MYSSLVAVLLLTSAANGSRGLGAVGAGKGVGWGGVGECINWSVYVHYPHRCTSAHHKLHMYTT